MCRRFWRVCRQGFCAIHRHCMISLNTISRTIRKCHLNETRVTFERWSSLTKQKSDKSKLSVPNKFLFFKPVTVLNHTKLFSMKRYNQSFKRSKKVEIEFEIWWIRLIAKRIKKMKLILFLLINFSCIWPRGSRKRFRVIWKW